MFAPAIGSIWGPGRRGVLGLLLSVLILGTVSGCGLLGGSSDSSGQGSGPLERSKIKVAVMPTIDLAPFHLAVKNGYFRAEGLEVELVNAPSGQVSLAKLLGGEVDIAYGSYSPFFLAKSKGAADIKFVSDASSAGPKSTMVVAMPNSPVHTVRDMAGKRVAVTGQDTMSDTLTKSALKTNGVDFNSVHWVSLPFPDIAPALARGDVDAGFLTEPFITQAAKSVGAIPVFDTATGPTRDFPTAGYGALGRFTSQNPKTVAAFQRVMRRATDEAADRTRIQPLMVEFAKVDQDTAALTTLLTFQSKLDARRLQRVPDLLREFGAVPDRIDAASMIAQSPTD